MSWPTNNMEHIFLDKLPRKQLVSKIPGILKHPKIYRSIYNRQQLFSSLRQINPIHALPFYSYFFKINFNGLLPPNFRSSDGASSFRFFNQNLILITLSYHAYHVTSPSHITWLITLILNGKKLKSWSALSLSPNQGHIYSSASSNTALSTHILHFTKIQTSIFPTLDASTSK
jgi:hypothetical protein